MHWAKIKSTNTTFLFFTDAGQKIQVNDVTVAGQDVKTTFKRDCETINSTTTTKIVVR